MTEEAIFELVVCAAESQRQAILDRECAGDENLRARLEALLAADKNPDFTIDQAQRDSESSIASVGTAGSMIVGKYKLIEAIGEGGMGSVWLAQQTEPVKRRVAVKLIKAGMDSKAVLARFEAERQALALMDHPNIAKVLDGGLHEGRPFFVMELFKGLPITEYCDVLKLNPRQRLELFVPVCQAIQHAHQKGIIHRDIKPSNVLVALYDDKPVPKVIDFGLAKATGGSLTELSMNTAFGGVVGTPQYMSPEQASLNNLDIDTRSDVYSLGILLYELLTGSPPFKKQELERAGMLEILRLVREEEPPKPSTKLSTSAALPSLSANRSTEPKKLTDLLRSELDWIVLKALEKDRTRRYDSANGFAADVQRYLSGEAVQAHPPSAAYRAKKFLRRYRRSVLASLLLFFALIAGITGTSWGLVRASAERDKALLAESAAQAAQKEAQNQASIASLERDKATAERDEKEKARTQEREALRIAQGRVVRLHLRTANDAAEKGELFNALHWYGAAWAADEQSAESGSIHRQRIGAALRLAPELQAVRFDSGRPQIVLFSPDAQTVLSVLASSPSLHLWDPETGRLKVPPLVHSQPIVSAEWTPDGRFVWTRAADNMVRVWNPQTGEMVGQVVATASQSERVVACVAPDAKTVLVAENGSGKIEQFDIGSGQSVRTWPISEEVISIRFSPAGNRFAYAIQNKVVLCDPAQEMPVASFPHRVESYRIAGSEVANPNVERMPLFSRDGRLLVTLVPGAKGFAAWNSMTGEKISEQSQLGVVYGATLSPSGRLILCYAEGLPCAYCTVCETQTGRRVAAIVLSRNISNGCFFPDERSVLLRMAGSSVERVEIATGQRQGPALRRCGRDPQVSPDGRTILLSDFDDITRVWRLRAPEPYSEYELANGGPADGCMATRDGSVHFEQVDGQLRVVKKETAGVALTDAPTSGKQWLSPDGRRAVVADAELGYRVWDTSTGQPLTDWFGPAADFLWAGFTADGDWLYTFSKNSEFECRDCKTWQLTPSRTIHHPDISMSTARLSPDGRFLATGGNQNHTSIFSTENPTKQPLLLRHGGWVWCVDFSPDGKRIVTASGDLMARVWDVGTGQPVSPPLRSADPHRKVAFSPDGELVLTLDLVNRPTLWDWRSAEIVARLPIIREVIRKKLQGAIWFSADGSHLAFQTTNDATKVLGYRLDGTNLATADFAKYLELLTSELIDETEAIVPVSTEKSRGEIPRYQAVWQNLHPELGSPDPLDPAINESLVISNPADLPKVLLTLEDASKRVGQIVSVEMTVRSTGKSNDGKLLFLNSNLNHRDADNFAATVYDVTSERLMKLGLPVNHKLLVDQTIVVQGEIVIFQEKPQINVTESGKIWILPPEPAE